MTEPVKRYRISYQRGVYVQTEAESYTGKPADASEPMVLASDYDALLRRLEEVRSALLKYGVHDRECMHRIYLGAGIGKHDVQCACGLDAALANLREVPREVGEKDRGK